MIDGSYEFHSFTVSSASLLAHALLNISWFWFGFYLTDRISKGVWTNVC